MPAPPVNAFLPARLEILTMKPPPRWRIAAAPLRSSKKAPFRLRSMLRCQSSGVISPTFRKTPWPALFTRMSSPPNCAVHRLEKLAHLPEVGDVGGVSDDLAERLHFTDGAIDGFRACARRWPRMRLRAAAHSAMARPMPRVPPVTIAILPDRDSIRYRIATGMSASAPLSPLRQILETRISQLSAEMEGLFAEAHDRGLREMADQLNQAVRRIRQAPDIAELGGTLLDAAVTFCTGRRPFHSGRPCSEG